MNDLNKAKIKTLAKYESILAKIELIESDTEESCAFCEEFCLTSVDCPAHELCGVCEPHKRDTIYREIVRATRRLKEQVLELISKIKALEEPEE